LDGTVGEVVQGFGRQSSEAHWIMPKQTLQRASGEDTQRWEGQGFVQRLLIGGAGACICTDSFSSEVSVVGV